MIQEEIERNPILANLPITLPSCRSCKVLEYCAIKEILGRNEFDIAALTYAKIEALMLSGSETAEVILSKLSQADVVLLDEAHQLAIPAAISVPVTKSIAIPGEYKVLRRIYDDWIHLCEKYGSIIQELNEDAKKGHVGQHLATIVCNDALLSWEKLKAAWKQLKELAIQKDLADEDILILRDFITILSNPTVYINYISENEGESGKICISAGEARQSQSLNEFLTKHAIKAKHVYVSGTLIEPEAGYFSELSGKEIKPVIFPDIREATKMMTLIPDRWKLTSRNFDDKLPAIIRIIQAIAEREKQSIYLLAPSRRKADILRNEIKQHSIKDIFVDYYRSDFSMGVERSERVCIAVGMAEIPANSCDILAKGGTPEDRWLNSQKLRRQAVDTVTWQAVNRVRDPAGKIESRVYFIGCRLEQVRKEATWGTNRKIVLKKIKETKGSDGKIIKTPIFDIHVDQDIATPRIYAEDKNVTRSDRRSVKDYIKKVDKYDNIFIKSENHYISSIQLNRGKVVEN